MNNNGYIPQCAMSIHAHPDDQEFSVGGTLAKWAGAGSQIISVIITSGDSGSNDPSKDGSYKQPLAELREKEQLAANVILGVKETIFLRYLLPSPDFPHSIQQAVAQGCGVDYDFPIPPSHDAIAQAGQCTRNVMGDYYPIAAWCDSDIFIARGWKACFKEAGVE